MPKYVILQKGSCDDYIVAFHDNLRAARKDADEFVEEEREWSRHLRSTVWIAKVVEEYEVPAAAAIKPCL